MSTISDKQWGSVWPVNDLIFKWGYETQTIFIRYSTGDLNSGQMQVPSLGIGNGHLNSEWPEYCPSKSPLFKYLVFRSQLYVQYFSFPPNDPVYLKLPCRFTRFSLQDGSEQHIFLVVHSVVGRRHLGKKNLSKNMLRV